MSCQSLPLLSPFFGISLGVSVWIRTYRSDTSGIRLHTRNPRFLCFANDLRRDILVEIQRHDVIHIRLNSTESVAVLEALLHGSDGRDQVGL